MPARPHHPRRRGLAAVILSAALVCFGDDARADDLVLYVNTLQGTNSRFELTHGNTFPAVAMPNGMQMWTPQTGRNGDGWKFQLRDIDRVMGSPPYRR